MGLTEKYQIVELAKADKNLHQQHPPKTHSYGGNGDFRRRKWRVPRSDVVLHFKAGSFSRFRGIQTSDSQNVNTKTY